MTKTALRKRRHVLVMVLTMVSGSADAIGFLALGGAFSSVMTGNMVLLGVGVSGGDLQLAGLAGLAIVSYILGVLCGARISGKPNADDSVWPVRVTITLGVEAVLLVAFLVIWEVTLADRSQLLEYGLLALAANSLGLQSSAVRRFGESNLSSTYLTGTLTGLISGLVFGNNSREQLPGLLVLLSLIIGAAAGGTAARLLPWLAPVVMLAPLLVVLTAGMALTATERRTQGRDAPKGAPSKG